MSILLQVVLLLGVIVGGSIAAYFFVKSQAHRKNLRAFAKSAKLSILYKNRYDYKLEGPYNDYEVKIEPYFLPTVGRKPLAWTHIQVGMNNPNHKFISLSKGMSDMDWAKKFREKKFVTVKHELADEIEILATDLFFSGILLSDQVKARAAHVFGLQDQMLLYLKAETLGVLLPQGPEWQERWKITAESMQLLSEIKDGLNPDRV
jgi:hypothetical protein